jgi:hypothetical protein
MDLTSDRRNPPLVESMAFEDPDFLTRPSSELEQETVPPEQDAPRRRHGGYRYYLPFVDASTGEQICDLQPLHWEAHPGLRREVTGRTAINPAAGGPSTGTGNRDTDRASPTSVRQKELETQLETARNERDRSLLALGDESARAKSLEKQLRKANKKTEEVRRELALHNAVPTTRAAAENDRRPLAELSPASQSSCELPKAAEEQRGVYAQALANVKKLEDAVASKDREIAALKTAVGNAKTEASKREDQIKAGHAIEVKTLKDKLSVAGQETAKLRKELATLEAQHRTATEALQKDLSKEKAEHAKAKALVKDFNAVAADLMQKHQVEEARLKNELEEAKRGSSATSSASTAAGDHFHVPECIICYEPFEGRCIVASCGHVLCCTRDACKAGVDRLTTCSTCREPIRAKIQVYLP